MANEFKFLIQRLSCSSDIVLEWASEGRKLFVYQKRAFFSLGEEQNFTFSKHTAPPWDPKENCAALWGETRTQLEEKWLLHSLNECHSASLLLLRLSAQARAWDICVFTLSICPSASCQRMLRLHRRFRSSHLLWIKNLKDAKKMSSFR